ncbi:MAG: hypothetical protein C1941_04815 [Prosthecochloris sp.]|nr:hypothetical protein [Prosthecochloris sp.]
MKQRPDTTDPGRKITVANWLKALGLSPGILFSAGYLLIYLLTNSYLNSEFKKTISRTVEAASDNHYSLTIGHLRAGFDLHSLTLEDLGLTPADQDLPETAENCFSVRKLCLDDINLCNLLFSKKAMERSTREISRRILLYRQKAERTAEPVQ